MRGDKLLLECLVRDEAGGDGSELTKACVLSEAMLSRKLREPRQGFQQGSGSQILMAPAGGMELVVGSLQEATYPC